MTLKIIAAVLSIIPSLAFASPPSHLLPVAITIQYGELTTHFNVDPVANSVSMSNSNGIKKTKVISKENLLYLIGEVENLPATKGLSVDCARANMVVAIGEAKDKVTRKESCFGMKSITSEKFQKLANLLVVATN